MNRNIKPEDPEFYYSGLMRMACPLAGLDWHKFMVVRLKPGEAIKPHKHAHHLVMYYPEPAGQILITPEPGTVLYLPPGTFHEVPPVSRERVSIAMLIDKEK